MNVSMPYEQAVIPFLDELDEAARVIGAVNTINNLDGILTGYNTDYLGAVRALEEKTSLKGKSVAILGAGGAARAIAYGLREKGATVTIFNRSKDRGEAMSRDFDVSYGGTLDEFDAETKLIVDAKAARCETVNGTRMLVHQACGQVELYTGVDQAPFDVMESVLLSEIKAMS